MATELLLQSLILLFYPLESPGTPKREGNPRREATLDAELCQVVIEVLVKEPAPFFPRHRAK
jgi:hypothetical protein